MNGVNQMVDSFFYPRPEGRGYRHQFSDNTHNCPAVHGWDNDQLFHNRDQNAMNGVNQMVGSLFYPRPEGRGYRRQFSDKSHRCPAVHGWDTDQSFHYTDGVHAIYIPDKLVRMVWEIFSILGSDSISVNGNESFTPRTLSTAPLVIKAIHAIDVDNEN